MCGVVGFLYKDPGRTGPIGQVVLRMLDVLGSRGVDGTGVALYSMPREDTLVLRVMLGGHGQAHAQTARVKDRLERIATVQEAEVQHDYLRLVISDNDDVAALAYAVEHDDPGTLVFSI